MQAAVYYGPRDIRVEDVPRPEVAEDKLLIRIKACGICGSDLKKKHLLEAVIELTDGPRPIGRFEVKEGHTDTTANPGHLSGHNTCLSLYPI
jgi:threonine dehydrogenase-like Zn-dependent dehydrogenase